ncbi:hypothetical protein AAMO2058_000382200 [Amorphochlora amoebiformis]
MAAMQTLFAVSVLLICGVIDARQMPYVVDELKVKPLTPAQAKKIMKPHSGDLPTPFKGEAYDPEPTRERYAGAGITVMKAQKPKNKTAIIPAKATVPTKSNVTSPATVKSNATHVTPTATTKTNATTGCPTCSMASNETKVVKPTALIPTKNGTSSNTTVPSKSGTSSNATAPSKSAGFPSNYTVPPRSNQTQASSNVTRNTTKTESSKPKAHRQMLADMFGHGKVHEASSVLKQEIPVGLEIGDKLFSFRAAGHGHHKKSKSKKSSKDKGEPGCFDKSGAPCTYENVRNSRYPTRREFPEDWAAPELYTPFPWEQKTILPILKNDISCCGHVWDHYDANRADSLGRLPEQYLQGGGITMMGLHDKNNRSGTYPCRPCAPITLRRSYFLPEIKPDNQLIAPEYGVYPVDPVFVEEAGTALPPGNKKPQAPLLPPAVPLDNSAATTRDMLKEMEGENNREMYVAAGHDWFGTSMKNLNEAKGHTWNGGNKAIKDINYHTPEITDQPIGSLEDCVNCPPKYRIPEINIHGCMDCGRKNGPMDWVPPMMKPVPGRINAVITQNYDPMVPQKPEPSEAEIKAAEIEDKKPIYNWAAGGPELKTTIGDNNKWGKPSDPTH